MGLLKGIGRTVLPPAVVVGIVVVEGEGMASRGLVVIDLVRVVLVVVPVLVHLGGLLLVRLLFEGDEGDEPGVVHLLGRLVGVRVRDDLVSHAIQTQRAELLHHRANGGDLVVHARGANVDEAPGAGVRCLLGRDLAHGDLHCDLVHRVAAVAQLHDVERVDERRGDLQVVHVVAHTLECVVDSAASRGDRVLHGSLLVPVLLHDRYSNVFCTKSK